MIHDSLHSMGRYWASKVYRQNARILGNISWSKSMEIQDRGAGRAWTNSHNTPSFAVAIHHMHNHDMLTPLLNRHSISNIDGDDGL